MKEKKLQLYPSCMSNLKPLLTVSQEVLLKGTDNYEVLHKLVRIIQAKYNVFLNSNELHQNFPHLKGGYCS